MGEPENALPDDQSVQEILHALRRILHEDDMPDMKAEPFPLDESMLVGGATKPAPDQAPAPLVGETVRDASTGPHLTSAEPARAAAQSFAALRDVAGGRAAAALGRGAATIEDVVREEVRPLLAAWLDRHLPEVVERIVRAEVQRLSQG